MVRIDALSRLAQRDRVGDLPRDVRLWVWREVDEFPDRCSWVAFSYVHRHLVEAFGVSVDGADNLRASDAVDPVAHATEVAVDNALAVTLWREADGHLLERVRLQSMHEHPRQEARGAKMRTSVTAPSLWVVLEKVRNPVEAVHHASNHEKGRLLHRLGAFRAVRSWPGFAPDQECQDRDAEAATSVPPRASFNKSAWQCAVLLEIALEEQLAVSGSGDISGVGVFRRVPRCKVQRMHLHEVEEADTARISRHIFASTSCSVNFRWRLSPADRRVAPSVPLEFGASDGNNLRPRIEGEHGHGAPLGGACTPERPSDPVQGVQHHALQSTCILGLQHLVPLHTLMAEVEQRRTRSDRPSSFRN